MKKLYHKENNWHEKIDHARNSYKFQKELTTRLDSMQGDLTEINLLEIILWKTNRYPEFSNDLIQAINELKNNYTRDKAQTLLQKLLELKGFDLPMASTVLRFACPDHCQIIDQRVYRFISKEHDKLKLPNNTDKKIELYFQYLDELRNACTEYAIPFKEADRILYQLDKEFNSGHKIKY